MRAALALLLAAPALLAAAAPDVLLITLDTTRADALSCYGSKRSTPSLDALAARSTRFARAYTPVPQTLPAHASILTGLYPFRHGVRDNLINALGPDPATLATLLKARGYATAAVVAAPVLDHRFGLARGFDDYDDAIRAPAVERRAAEVTDLALRALPNLKRPFLLWVHYYDPHHPYAPPVLSDPPDPYRDEVVYMDREIGRLLQAVDLKTTLVAAVGDHGESLREHGELEHGLLLYEGAVRVPLLIHAPGQERGAVEEGAVSTTAVLPTLLQTLGLPLPGGLDGAPLPQPGEARPVYLETLYPFFAYKWAPLRGLVWKGDKLITTGSVDELYALGTDPAERKDLAAAWPDRTASLKARLASLNPEKAGEVRQSTPKAVDAELKKQLQSLGYLDGSFMDTGQITGALRHPRDVADLPEFLTVEGPAMLKARKLREFFNTMKEVLRRDPENHVAMNLAGLGFWEAGNPERALEVFDQALRAAPKAYYLVGNRGRTLYLLGRHAESERELRRALEMNPHYPEGYAYLFDTLLTQGKTAEAERVLDQADRAGASLPRLLYDRGLIRLQKGDCRGAMPLFQAALQGEPRQAETLGNLAHCAAMLGDTDRAWGYLQMGLAAAPEDYKMLKAAYALALQTGREQGAREAASAFIRLFPMTEEARAMRERFPDLP
jgi:arylsulfatase A-like enzyme/Tfp pilus assembly protein PilF